MGTGRFENQVIGERERSPKRSSRGCWGRLSSNRGSDRGHVANATSSPGPPQVLEPPFTTIVFVTLAKSR
jgi:hypothetical protein